MDRVAPPPSNPAPLSIAEARALAAAGPLAWIAPHCDIVERLGAVPPSAQLRGVWFRILERLLERRGLLPQYRAFFPDLSPSSLSFSPVADFLPCAAVAGALVATPERLHDGMFELTRENAHAFAKTLFGRTLLRLLANEPKRLAQQAIASRRQTTNYGSWELSHAGPNQLRMMHREEYVWIESYMRGAALGTYESCGLACEAEVVMDDRFNGAIVVSWA